ncbi:MAG: hypothetical protein Q4D21_07510 [Phascolarctobacterium sp.]|nr:hypothetical protein [Phascolarctobacterium sp.]
MQYQLPQSQKLNIASLSQLFGNTSACYKFFWFQAILNHFAGKNGPSLAERNNGRISFDSLIDEMIVNAWFMVNEYHLKLGPADNLERIVGLLHVYDEKLKPNSKRGEALRSGAVLQFKNFLTTHDSNTFLLQPKRCIL